MNKEKTSIDDITKNISNIKLKDDIIKNDTEKLLINIIDIQKKKELDVNIWSDSIYKQLPTLQSNNVGNVGEMLLQNICKLTNIDSNIDGSKTKKIGGSKEGDGTIKSKTVEIKTAHLGSTTPSFQHELGEYPWNTEYIIFVDIGPKDAYITIFKNFTQEQYCQNNFKCAPVFPTKSITRRKGVGNFKLDTSPKINDICVKNGYSINITDNNIIEIGNFIDKKII